MAQKVQFLGFKRVLAAGLTMQNDYLYFVRESVSDNEGKLWFNGVCYGSCRDTEVEAINTALEGFLTGQSETGYTNVKEYIDNAIAELEAGFDSTASGESADGHVSVKVDIENGELTAVTVTTSDIASATALTAEETARENADEALQTEIDAIETAVGLSTGGTYVPGDGKYTSGATSTQDAIDKLDDALASAVTDLEDAIEEAINELDATVSATSTNSYMTVEVVEENGKLTSVSLDDSALNAAIEAMDLGEVHEAGKAIVAIQEEDGVVTATAGTVAAQYVDVADTAGKFTGTTVETVLAEIDDAYKAADAAIVGDATTSGDTLGKLEDRIEALDADAKEYHLVKVTTGLAANIKEEYYLADADGNQSGDTISIPKDSHIVEINYITASGDPHYQNLEYVYIDVCGATKTEYVDMSQLVLEQEFASGVQITNHIAHGVVDPTSETFLTVGADGFKLSGVQDAIDDAIEALDYTDTASTGQYVSKVDEADGVISVTRANVSEAVLNNYSKGSDATAVAATDTVNEAISKLENQVDAAKAAATTKVVEGTDAGNNMEIVPRTGADSSVTYTINLTDVASATALTAEETAREEAVSALTDALETTATTLSNMIADLTDELETKIEEEVSARTEADETLQDNIDALQAELDAVEGSLGFNNTAYTNSGTYISGVTVAADIKALDDAISAAEESWMDALQDEQDARESGDTAIMESLATTASTLEDAIENEASARTAADEALEDAIDAEVSARTQADNALDERLDVIEAAYITGATVNGVEATVADNHATVTIDAGDVEIGKELTGTTGGIHFDSGATTDDVLQEIVDVLNQSVAGSYTGVTSSDGSISITTPQANGQNLSVNTKTLDLSDVQAGETEVKKDETTGALYGVMYWIDEETA